jgi:hypothetical protein
LGKPWATIGSFLEVTQVKRLPPGFESDASNWLGRYFDLSGRCSRRARQFFRLPAQIPTVQNSSQGTLMRGLNLIGRALGTVIARLDEHSPPEVMYETNSPYARPKE